MNNNNLTNEKDAESLLTISRTTKYPNRNKFRAYLMITFAIVMLILGIWTTVIGLIPINFILFAFMGLFVLLFLISVYKLVQFNRAENLQAKVTKEGVHLSSGVLIPFGDIAKVKYSREYEKFFLKLIGTNISAYSFGRLTLIKKDNSRLNLWFVEDVEKVANELIKLIQQG